MKNKYTLKINTMLAATSKKATILIRASTAHAQPSTASAGAILISRRKYHENIVEHYENPRNVGSMNKNDENVGTVSFA